MAAGRDLRVKPHDHNVLAISPVTVNPTLFMQDGTELALAPVTIAASSVASININDAVSRAPGAIRAHLSTFGAVGLTYQGPWVGSVLSSVKNVDEVRRITFLSHLHSNSVTVHDKASPQLERSVEGLWWRQTKATGGFLTLTNTAFGATRATIQFLDAGGAVAYSTRVQVPTHSTSRLDLEPIFDQIRTSQGTFRVTYTGPSYGLSVETGLEDDAVGYSAEVVTSQMQADTGNEVAETIAYDSAGMMTGKPEPQMQFPTGTEFSPYAVIANRTDRTISVAASAAFQQGTSPIELALPSIRLAPRSTVKADIASALKAAGVTPEEYINLRFSFTGRHGDILLATGSVDQTNDFVFEVPPAIEVKSNSRMICYWQVFNDTSSMISLWNYSKADEDFSLTLSFAGGSYRLPVSLAAGESRTIDVGKLIHQQTPDALGKTIPVSVTQGSALLSGPRSEADLMEVASSASIFNVRTATCGVVCTSCNGVSGGFLDQAPFPLKVGSTAQGNAKVQFQTGSTQSWSSSSWTSAKTSVAATSASGLIQGMSAGTATLNFTITGLNGYTGAGEACTNGMSTCPPLANPFYGQGSGTVANCPTSITINQANSIVPSLSTYISHYSTGMGLIAYMQVAPSATNFDNTVISETVSGLSNSCPQTIPSLASSAVCQGSATFTVGAAGGYVAGGLLFVPDIHNEFWDDHESLGNYSRLEGTSTQSCTVVCAQTYFCGGSPIANFRITRTFTQGVIGPAPVTFVTAIKQ